MRLYAHPIACIFYLKPSTDTTKHPSMALRRAAFRASTLGDWALTPPVTAQIGTLVGAEIGFATEMLADVC